MIFIPLSKSPLFRTVLIKVLKIIGVQNQLLITFRTASAYQDIKGEKSHYTRTNF